MRPSRPAGSMLDRRGVALPLALLGLVAVTLLVTTALVTGSTESALSLSQQSASQRLYLADAGIEAFLRNRWDAVGTNTPQPLQGGRDSLTLNGQTVVIDVSRLRREQDTIPEVRDGAGVIISPQRIQRMETFSLVGSPRRGGRAVGAMYTTRSEWSTANLNINSAGSVAADLLRIPGNSGAMSGVDQSGCADMYDGTEGGTDALQISDSVRLDLDTARVLEGDSGHARVTRTDMNRYEFALHVLGGNTPEALAASADLKFGEDLPAPGGGTEDGYPISGLSGLRPGPENSLDSHLNWGCPAGAHKLGDRAISTSACTRSIQDTSRYPVIAVKSPGGSFKIQGYGQGFLIVIGDIDLRDLNFFGVVVVTGDVQLNGTGYIGGAFVSLGDATLGVENQQGDPDETLWNGRTFVRFNRCGLNMAQAALAGQNGARAQQQFDGRSLSWFEIVR